MKKKLRIKIDQDLCIGCTTCAALCPKYYEMSETTGKAQPVQELVEESSDFDEVIEAESSCPVDAITVEEHDS